MSKPFPEWVEQEMATLVLGERRLEQRAKQILVDFSQNPSGSIPEFCSTWAATKATYEFMKNPTSSPQALFAAHRRATLNRAAGYPEVLVLQDTTSFNFSHHPATEGIGPLENQYCRGFLAHSALLATPTGIPLGLVAQQVWVRSDEAVEVSKSRPISEKESYKWLQGLNESIAGLPTEQAVLVVSDRESDIFEYFVQPRPAQVNLLLRASQDRAVTAETKLLFLTVSSGPVRGKIQVQVPRHHQQPARLAECQLYYQTVTIKPPRKRPAHLPKLAPVKLSAVLLVELHPPQGVPPLEWFLLTTLAVTSFAQASQMLEFYACRWLVERFHFVLKSGCGLEQRQLTQADALMRFLALANIVACRLLTQTYLSREAGQLPCSLLLTEAEWKALYCFTHKTPLAPADPPSLAQATLWLAKLGGFLARKADGPPGVKVLWRGWRRLFDITETWLLFNSSPTSLSYG